MTDYKNVIYSYVSYRRNIKDMPFVSKLGDIEMALGVARSLSEIFGDDLEFKNLRNLDLNTCLKLEEEEIFTKELIENKDIAGYAISENGEKRILINEQDHIRLIVQKKGFCLEECFNMANKMDDLILEKLEMCFNTTFGYLTASPELFGTGMQIGCVLFLPALWQSKKIKKLQGELLKGEFEFLALDGKLYSGNSPFIKIQNIYTFGHKENEFAEGLHKVVTKLLELEEVEENKIFNLSPALLADSVFRAFGICANCYRLSFSEAEQNLGLVLWGLNLKMLIYKKKFDIYAFLAKIKENNLSNSESLKETEKLRAKKISNKLLECVQKGEIDV